jgi:RNA polymerase sigma factor (sigma-70 family)
MAFATKKSLQPLLRKLAQSGDVDSATDGQLLECFLTLRQESAFRTLVDRHGPMVLGVCRRVLHDVHDAEDAFQATFLVLVRKAATVVPREFVANWLYGVACRTAQKLRVSRTRADAARRRLYDRVTAMAERTRTDDEVWRDLQPVLDQELQRLPDKYRVAVVLCDLEGKPRKQAAEQLGWPEGTLSGRLARARKLLATRLTRRGVTLSVATLAATLAKEGAAAAVPAVLKSNVTRAAVLMAGGEAVPAKVVSAQVSDLTERVTKTLLVSRLRLGLLFVTAVALAAVGAGLVARNIVAGVQQPPRPDDAKPKTLDRAELPDNKARPADVEMHVIGVGEPKEGRGGRVFVEVRPTARPVVLVLTSYNSVEWHVKLAEGARVKKAIVSGYFAQEINGLPADVPVENRSWFPNDGSRRKNGWFYASEWNTPEYREMARRLNELTGLPIASFQSADHAESFIVDGSRGREHGQKTLQPRPPTPKEPTPDELRASLANGELHVVAVYRADFNNRGKPVDVEVRPTTRPVVLVLMSYMEAVWNVRCRDGARVQAVIVGGGFPQEVDGLPEGVPVHRFCQDASTYYFDRRAAFRDKGSFYAYRPNTFDYRRAVERLNDVTGLLVATFQGQETGNSFVVDGTRGREFAQKERRPRPARPKEATSEEFRAACVGADLHVIGTGGPGPKSRSDWVDVEVRPTARPVVLALSSYNSVLWKLKIADGVQVRAVVIAGYSEQEFEGIPAGISVAYRAAFPHGSNRDDFYASKPDTLEYRRTAEKLNDLTGLLVATYQWENAGTSFVVDGTRGGEFVQKERRPRPVRPKRLTPEEIRAVCAGAELHAVSMYWATPGDNGAPVDVEVRPTGKPVVLVLASYMSALWRVKIAEGARVRAVILGGQNEQEFEGVPADVPVIYRASRPSGRTDSFCAWKSNTLEYRRMVESLNDLTGLLISTFQVVKEADAFVVDGVRGRDLAQKDRKPRPTLPKEPTPQELLAASAGAELHVVGVYGAGDGDNGGPIDVEVRAAAKPVVLVLTSYYPVLWKVKIAAGAQVRAVILGGYGEQEIEGLPAGIPVLYRAGRSPRRDAESFYAYDASKVEYRRLVGWLNDLTGLLVSTFQGKERAVSFVIDGTRGREFAQKEREKDRPKTPENIKKVSQPQAEEEPLADVADVPAKDLRAGGDADKRYFLIGPKKDAKPPAEGFGLVVILPGGDGSADFNPFVRRIFKYALPDRYLAAQPVAVEWFPGQPIVWPTKTNRVDDMKFSTEEFVAAVIEDVAKKHKIDRTRVFSLSWSSSGPAAYAVALQEKRPVTGSLVTMSVFNPPFLPPLKAAKGHAFYLYHSPDDRVCPYRMAEQAKKDLAANGAKVRLETYAGGHGWRGNVYRDIRKGVDWLEENREKAGGPPSK